MKLVIVGGGLSGVEAAYQAAERGISVDLIEMRPIKMTPAHNTGQLCELVCSNSLRAKSLSNASGLLKQELYLLNSIVMKVAYETEVEAGGALAVDRHKFGKRLTDIITEHPNINVIKQEAVTIPKEKPTIIATGPLTSEDITNELIRLTGSNLMYFYDAAAPIVTYESINNEIVFQASRYEKGTPDYLNCPMTKEEYLNFWESLVEAELTPLHEFEDKKYFEGCMPIEVLAKRGQDTLRYGPMKPVGLIDPNTGNTPYAVVQLRKDNQDGTLYNLVGFQTRLKWGEQKRVLKMIPGLETAEFVRLGVMHRNTYINSPEILSPTYQLNKHPDIFLAGQITGVEGYIESVSSGLVAGINASRLIQGKTPKVFPRETATGALPQYITEASPDNFQPMNINFGLLPPLPKKYPKNIKREKLSERALEILQNFQEEIF